MTAIGHGPISAVMSYTTLGWGSIGGTFIMHVCVAMVLLSGGPVIFELPLTHPDLVFTREWGGICHYRYSWCYVQMVTHAQMETVIRWWLVVLMIMLWTSINDLCIWCSVGDHMVLRFIFWVPDLLTWKFIQAFNLGIPSILRNTQQYLMFLKPWSHAT